jgi:hypothetical protein
VGSSVGDGVLMGSSVGGVLGEVFSFVGVFKVGELFVSDKSSKRFAVGMVQFEIVWVSDGCVSLSSEVLSAAAVFFTASFLLFSLSFLCSLRKCLMLSSVSSCFRLR